MYFITPGPVTIPMDSLFAHIVAACAYNILMILDKVAVKTICKFKFVFTLKLYSYIFFAN